MRKNGFKNFCLFLAGLAFFTGCNRSPPPKGVDSLVQRRYFNAEDVTLLVISKNNPDSDDRWTATFKKDLVLSKRGHTPVWRIDSAAHGDTLNDSFADGGFINHLLSSISTLKIQKNPLNGPPDSFGLNPHHWGFRLNSGDKKIELRLGEPTEQGAARFGMLLNLDQKDETIYVLRGSFLRLLDHLEDFSFVRLKRLMPIPEDEVLEIKIKHKGAPNALFAERRGPEWVNSLGKGYKKDVGSWLTDLFQAEIVSFTTESPHFMKNADHSIEVKTRNNGTLQIEFRKVQNETYATTSIRPGAIFKMKSPLSLAIFNQ